MLCGVNGHGIERQPGNLKVPTLIPGGSCQLYDFHWPKDLA